MVEYINKLMKKYYINIRNIYRNSDNEMDDIKDEACIVLQENYDEIKKSEKVFLSLLRRKCLKNNKYGRRIESKNRWEKFNELEENMFKDVPSFSIIDENVICEIQDVKDVTTKEEYDFLICYYENGCKYTAQKYKLTESATRQRVHRLITRVKKEVLR